jgi:hypothetical protein
MTMTDTGVVAEFSITRRAPVPRGWRRITWLESPARGIRPTWQGVVTSSVITGVTLAETLKTAPNVVAYSVSIDDWSDGDYSPTDGMFHFPQD